MNFLPQSTLNTLAEKILEYPTQSYWQTVDEYPQWIKFNTDINKRLIISAKTILQKSQQDDRNAYTIRRINKLPQIEKINSIQHIKNFPILKREDIRERKISSIINSSIPHYTLYTSGSTGEPLEFFIDKVSFARRSFVIHYILSRLYCPTPRILRLNFQDMPWSYCQGIFFNTHSLVHKNREGVQRFLNKFRPNVLYGTVSNLVLFSEFFEKLSLSWNFKVILSRSEHLTQPTRERLEKIMGGQAYNIYASREFGPIGFECLTKNGFHLNEDEVFVEIEKGTGMILITSLYNRSMVFIRYKIGDRGYFLPKPCTCGLTTKKIIIEGRTSDFIYLPNKQKRSSVDLFNVLGKTGGINAFQCIQSSDSGITINIIRKKDHAMKFSEERLRQEVLKCLRHLGERFTIIIKYVSTIPLLPNGKRKLLISTVHNEE